MRVSVVIPAKNEAPWLERLLCVLRGWDPEMEIVVADHQSTDLTREVAVDYGCKTVVGGLPGLGRNRGAEAASGNYLLFVDADVIPTVDALVAAKEEAQREANDVVSFRHIPLSDDIMVRFFYAIADMWFSATGRTRSKQSLASFLLVSRECFESLDGFDISLSPGEDVDFVRRAGRRSKVRYLRKAIVLVSPRRFSTEPKYWFAIKTAMWGVLRALGVRATIIPYRWIPHDSTNAETEANWLQGHPKYGR